MKHRKKNNSLKRKSAHRKSMLANMASSLIIHKRIKTTLAKAKALRVYVEPVLTRSKKDDTHSRRVVFRYLKDKDAVKELFGSISEKILNRPGGYTRIIKLGKRLGDAAEICFIELVDFNDIYNSEVELKKTRRSRRGGKSKKQDDTKVIDSTKNPTVKDVPATEEPVAEDAPANEEPVVEDAPATEEPVVEDAPATEEPVVEDAPVSE
ncbi:MAG: 50S ribosomal protein L17, partial [Flavobacteriales bacterium TMED113]